MLNTHTHTHTHTNTHTNTHRYTDFGKGFYYPKILLPFRLSITKINNTLYLPPKDEFGEGGRVYYPFCLVL